MAGLRHTTNFFDVALPVNAWKTVAAVRAPTNQMVQVLGATISTNGVSGSAEAYKVRLNRITPGNGTGTSFTPVKIMPSLSTTVQATARVAFTGTEPTEAGGGGQYYYPSFFHPQGGIIREVVWHGIYIPEGGEFALQVFVPTGGASDTEATGHMLCEE